MKTGTALGQMVPSYGSSNSAARLKPALGFRSVSLRCVDKFFGWGSLPHFQEKQLDGFIQLSIDADGELGRLGPNDCVRNAAVELHVLTVVG